MNMKISFIVSGLILLILTVITMKAVQEKPYRHSGLLNKRRKPYSLIQRITKIGNDFYCSLKKIPPRFKMICIIHSLSWAGIFIFWLYFTTAIAQNLYGLPVHANTTGNYTHNIILQKATLDSSFYLAIYQYVSIIYSALLYFVSTHLKKNIYIHAASLFIGGIAILLLPFENTPFTIEAAMVAYGIMWGSILVLPYAIAIQFLPKGKLGIYLGIFNICITAPQILCSLLLSVIYYYLLNENASYLLSLGGLMIIMSAYLWLKIVGGLKTNLFLNLRQILSYKSS